MKAKVVEGKGFRGVLNYVLGAEKQAQIIAGTMIGQTPRELATEFGIGRQLRPDIEKPVWHVSLAAAPGESLSAEKWEAVVNDFMTDMGLRDNPYVVVKHTDTAHDHVHIIASRIGIDGALWDRKWKAYRAIEATQKIELKHGLTRTPGLESAGNGEKRLTANELNQAARTGQEPTRQQLQKLVAEASADNPTATVFVERLATAGVQVKANIASTGKMNGFGFEFGGIAMKGSDLGKGYRWQELSKRVDYDAGRDAEALRTMAATTTTKGESYGREETGAIDLAGNQSQTRENLRQDDPRDRGAGKGNELARGGTDSTRRAINRVGLYRTRGSHEQWISLSRGPKNAGVGRQWQAERNSRILLGGEGAGGGAGRQRAVGVGGQARDGLDAGTAVRASTSGGKPRVHLVGLWTNWAGEAETKIYGDLQSLSSGGLAYQQEQRNQDLLHDNAGGRGFESASIWGTGDIFGGVRRAEGSVGSVESGAREAGGGISNGGQIRTGEEHGPDGTPTGDNTLDIGSPAGNRDTTATRTTTGAPGRSSGTAGTSSAGYGETFGGDAGEPQAAEGRGSQQTDGDPQGLGERGETARPRGKGSANVGNQGTGVDAGDKATTGEQSVGNGSSGDGSRDNERGAYERVLGLDRMSEAAKQKARIWGRQAEGLEASAYRLTLVGRGEGQKSFVVGKQKDGTEKLYSADEIRDLIPALSRKNAQGYDVYITPVNPKHHYLVIDDVSPEKLVQAKRAGIQPCVMLESSRNNFQMILKVPKLNHPDENQAVNSIVRELNGKYGDPQFSGAVHPFRLGGFSNRKAGRNNVFVRIVEASGLTCESTTEKLERARVEMEDRRAQTERLRREGMIAGEGEGKAENLAAAYRQAAKRAKGYLKTNDWSRIDFHAAKIMLVGGWKGEAVKRAILEGSPDIATRKHDPEAYAERTIDAAKRSKDVLEAQAARAQAQARQSRHRGFGR